MNLEKFKEAWDDLSEYDKIDCYNEYCYAKNDPDNVIAPFDEEFFRNAFSEPMEAARAVHFGNIKTWNDPYIKFNGYGNLVSLSKSEAVQKADDCIDDIYDHEEIWSRYIDEDDYMDEEKEEGEEEEEEDEEDGEDQ